MDLDIAIESLRSEQQSAANVALWKCLLCAPIAGEKSSEAHSLHML